MNLGHDNPLVSPPTNPDQLIRFEESILRQIAQLRDSKRCKWCRSPNRAVRSRGLCSSCYRWYGKQRHLATQVGQLPPKVPKDPHFQLRHELEVANCAIEDCKRDGQVLDDTLDRVDAIDLEHEFEALAKRLIGSEQAARLFHGHTWWFYNFSPIQKIWISHLISLITSETNHQRRLERARLQVTIRKNREAVAWDIAASDQDSSTR